VYGPTLAAIAARDIRPLQRRWRRPTRSRRASKAVTAAALAMQQSRRPLCHHTPSILAASLLGIGPRCRPPTGYVTELAGQVLRQALRLFPRAIDVTVQTHSPASQGHEPRHHRCHGSCSNTPPSVSCSLRASAVMPTHSHILHRARHGLRERCRPDFYESGRPQRFALSLPHGTAPADAGSCRAPCGTCTAPIPISCRIGSAGWGRVARFADSVVRDSGFAGLITRPFTIIQIPPSFRHQTQTISISRQRAKNVGARPKDKTPKKRKQKSKSPSPQLKKNNEIAKLYG
jgi:hypothetical protein